MSENSVLSEQPAGDVAHQAGASPEQVDVLVVGAGLSGIAAGYHLQRRCPKLTYLIVESRDAIGGTWDLFRYPGIRSDSDMFTLGYAHRPWRGAKAIADGPSILAYVRDAASEHGIDRHIRFHHRVRRASWSTDEARWLVEAERSDTGQAVRLSCGFLIMCSGYYSYAEGHAPEFPGARRFGGKIVHPQFWPDDLDYAGKRVVVIGSGATAVTIAPEMAKQAAHVTMLQRSPTYIVARPAEDTVANWLRHRLPAKLAYAITRWKNVGLTMYFYRIARQKPEAFKQRVLAMTEHALGPDYDVRTHFTPRYNPWDQRLCLIPDADLFKAMRAGTVSIATDEIDTFTESGIRLSSGRELEADIVVTATGLKLNLLGDVQFTLDGVPLTLADHLSYKGVMFSDVPNLASVFGYTNASWTLKADLTLAYVCRLLNHMRRRGFTAAMPRRDPSVEERPFIDFTSGYVQRALHLMPKQGARTPWKMHQNYARDMAALRFRTVSDGVMQFSRPSGARDKRASRPAP